MPTSELLALSAATFIALSGMLINELKGKVDILRLARWQMLTAFILTGAVSLAVGGWHTIAPWQFGFLAASSLFGIIFASTTYFAAIYAAGARTTALLFSLTAPFALLMGYVALGETISLKQGIGVALVLSGIVTAIGLRRPQGKKPDAAAGPAVVVPWKGIALGIVTAFGQALGSLCARPAMAAGAEPFTAMAIRAGIAAVFFLALLALPIPALQRPYRFAARPLIIAVTAAFCGTGLGMSLLMAALVNGNVGIVSTLSSMTPVVILPMVWIRTGVAPPLHAWAGALLAVAGTALISL
ncbi:DMT family transporter [Pararhizobium sp.]|uniref:DMT family transporter n=1 Tax=Pararhizobium sp. TaxID=1977563 RepID=UPI0027165FBC|nr:DMT family transporter [Pararhizobium sp.]MDO9414925.1 DMT family transporter [Pararhizobium sp.]